jgi:tetratricopeptide (TPR) repeat protein
MFLLESKELYFSSLLNLGLCHMSLWELSIASKYLEELCSLANHSIYYRYLTGASFCIAFIYSCIGNDLKAKKIADFVNSRIQSEELLSWGTGYRFIFLGLTYKYLGLLEKSFSLYSQAIKFSQRSNYTQVLGLAKIGVAEIHRINQRFNKALDFHCNSIEILKGIGAKCDLAEAYFQLGLTYQAMREHDQAETYKAKALELFKEMKAPKQCERVDQAFEQGAQQ